MYESFQKDTVKIMKKEMAAELLSENLKNIFAFSISNLFDKQDAEDLTNDIIVEVLSSVDRLESDDAFYGFMWQIARNTLKKHIRRKNSPSVKCNYDFYGVNWETPEEQVIENEELMVLRRELSLLSKQYREVTVRYYVKNKTVSEISKELKISEEMVKYYLFKTRKILKEGVQMQRNFGEKSYNPGTFGINFWGFGENFYVWHTFERKLPGNIVLAAYEKPLTLWELSLELGVSAAYLEDELDILLDYNFVKKTGDKYQTNFIIFKEDYEEKFFKIILSMLPPKAVVKKITKSVEENLSELRKMDFGLELDDNKLRWFIVNYLLFHTMEQCEEKITNVYGGFPRLTPKARGFVYGHDNNYTYGHFQGIYDYHSNDKKSCYGAVNYNIIKECQCWHSPSFACNDLICDAVLGKDISSDEELVAHAVSEGAITIENGKMRANFPVFTVKQKQEICELFAPVITTTYNYIEELCEASLKLLKKYVPKNLSDKCEVLCFVRHLSDAVAIIMEQLVKIGYLTVPDEKANLCFFGIRND